jgi:rare lipoprotein A (peptidoglycan hydrolase)
MKLLVATTTLLAAGFSIATSTTGEASSISHLVALTQASNCGKTYTVPMAQRAARAVYMGVKDVTQDERQMLGRIEKCQRNLNARSYVSWYYMRRRNMWKQRRYDAAHPMSIAVASWYDQSGPGACGTGAQDGLAFASLILPCGAQIEICAASCTVATMKDHGPYVGGRTFDLNVNLRNAISCAGVCTVKWRRIN